MARSLIVELIVEDFGPDPGIVSQLLGLNPTNAYARGQPLEGSADPSEYDRLAREAEEWEGRYVGKPLPFSSELSLDEGLAATVKWIETNSPRSVHRKSVWRLESPDRTSGSHIGLLEALVLKLKDKSDGIHACAKRFPIYVRCGLFVANDQAQLSLPERLIMSLAKLGLRIEFDVYFNAGESENCE